MTTSDFLKPFSNPIITLVNGDKIMSTLHWQTIEISAVTDQGLLLFTNTDDPAEGENPIDRVFIPWHSIRAIAEGP